MLKLAGVLLALAINALCIMLMWNILMPELFHLAQISYWQAIGLGVLGNCLVGRSNA